MSKLQMMGVNKKQLLEGLAWFYFFKNKCKIETVQSHIFIKSPTK